jgi:hypothetical protein
MKYWDISRLLTILTLAAMISAMSHTSFDTLAMNAVKLTTVLFLGKILMRSPVILGMKGKNIANTKISMTTSDTTIAL